MQHVAPTLLGPADNQAISLLDITAPARLVEPSLAEKARAAVAVVKGLLQAGKHLVAASSFEQRHGRASPASDGRAAGRRGSPSPSCIS